MEIHIRNMVCNRCIMAVKAVLDRLGIGYGEVRLGTAELYGPLPDEVKGRLETELEAIGFGLIDDRRSRVVEQIKTAVISVIHHGGEADIPARDGNFSLRSYLCELCHADYSSISRLFSEMTGMSIEHYYIAQRVEKAKELLAYGELTVSEIADRLGYSSPAHLSAQFRSITGLSPRDFRNLKDRTRIPLDRI